MASEYYTGARSQINYGLEDTYGTAPTTSSVDGYPGLLMGFDPTKNDLGYIEIYGLDSGTKDVNQHIETTQRYGGTIRIRPQHGVFIAYAYDAVDDTNFTDTAKFHSLGDLTDENFDLNSMTIESYKVHSTAGSSHKEVYKGVKFNTLELTVDKGTPLCEVNIDFDAQSLTQSNSGPPAFETTLTNLKKYNANTVSPTLRPYMWKDLFVEIHDPASGNQVITDIVSCRVKVDNELLVDYTADATLSGQISEPVPQRRKHEIEITARMNSSTYFDYWKDLTELSSINPTYSASAVCEADGGAGASGTVMSVDDGNNSQLTALPSLGILGVDNDSDGVADEFMAFYDRDDSSAGTHVLQVGRGLFGSSGVVVADDDPCAIFGNITVALNKGANAINSTGSDTQGLNKNSSEDILVFTGWDCRVTTFGSPIDIGQGVVESTFLIRPAHLVPWVMDGITEGYFDTS